MKFEKYYSPDKTEFRGYIIEHNGMYLSTDWEWVSAKTHACRITPEMLGGQFEAEVIFTNEQVDRLLKQQRENCYEAFNSIKPLRRDNRFEIYRKQMEAIKNATLAKLSE